MVHVDEGFTSPAINSWNIDDDEETSMVLYIKMCVREKRLISDS